MITKKMPSDGLFCLPLLDAFRTVNWKEIREELELLPLVFRDKYLTTIPT